ncbi:uncharacterized protein KQ657_004597 [Scheffersomyces spartinae]|uniref:Uncharacterized protein n=1 Tax=Scheffersomyces spartinae TaxID=45513 RepID=A0A9P8AJ55_9ASCO|nr:uncharacterized protein KQ657_004597 [Scheffersomyces spartinae]KAG7194385.1 hypothetical protein KQ657_004597 [Scheffersomyces spartinae]
MKELTSCFPNGQVGSLYIALYSTKSNRIREKYILKFNDLISLGLTHLPPSLCTETEDEVTIDETPINVEEINWDDIFAQLKTLLFKHIEELKRICLSQVELPDLFFKVLIDANETQSLQGIDNDWVQISVSSKLEDATDQFQSKVVLIGDASMGILNFDVHNEYSVE